MIKHDCNGQNAGHKGMMVKLIETFNQQKTSVENIDNDGKWDENIRISTEWLEIGFRTVLRVNITCSFLVKIPSFYTTERPINYFSNVTSKSQSF